MKHRNGPQKIQRGKEKNRQSTTKNGIRHTKIAEPTRGRRIRGNKYSVGLTKRNVFMKNGRKSGLISRRKRKIAQLVVSWSRQLQQFASISRWKYQFVGSSKYYGKRLILCMSNVIVVRSEQFNMKNPTIIDTSLSMLWRNNMTFHFFHQRKEI